MSRKEGWGDVVTSERKGWSDVGVMSWSEGWSDVEVMAKRGLE